ncbi:hypothetical protein GOODEAATRI_015796 [Goodea atripinnis]|uniref:Uncharacterized protein n=1 Tax=Goodea atripinnis TaxID=208336 RepID=A0ABV0PP01_9TELE
MMSSVGRQDPPGQPAFSSDYLSGPMTGGMTGQWSLNKTKDSSMPDSFLGLLYFYNPCLHIGLLRPFPPLFSHRNGAGEQVSDKEDNVEYQPKDADTSSLMNGSPVLFLLLVKHSDPKVATSVRTRYLLYLALQQLQMSSKCSLGPQGLL